MQKCQSYRFVRPFIGFCPFHFANTRLSRFVEIAMLDILYYIIITSLRCQSSHEINRCIRTVVCTYVRTYHTTYLYSKYKQSDRPSLRESSPSPPARTRHTPCLYIFSVRFLAQYCDARTRSRDTVRELRILRRTLCADMYGIL